MMERAKEMNNQKNKNQPAAATPIITPTRRREPEP